MKRTLPGETFEVEILIEGELNRRRAGWFEGFIVTILEGQKTRIQGKLPDQAALFGLISRIRDLGLKLISINRIES